MGALRALHPERSWGGSAQEHVPGMQPIPSTADICIQEGSNLDSLLNSLLD